MRYSDWLARRDENFRVGLSDVGPDTHDMLPPMDSPGAFFTIGDDKPPTPRRVTSAKKCKCGRGQRGKRT